MFIDVDTFTNDLRKSLEDQTGDIPQASIITNLNLVLMRIAREKGLEKLFLYQDTLELGRIKEDGSPAAAWTINGVKEDEGEGRPIGQIIDIKSLLILKTENCHVRPVEPCYLPYKYFRKEHPFPECLPPGDPCFFTVYQFQGKTKLMFDRPINRPYAIDMMYSAFHPRVSKGSDVIRIPSNYEDLLIELVKVYYFEGSSDMATSYALEDRVDYLVAQIREQLAAQSEALPMRQVNRSY